ncbi:uncharacterized protein K452DRAFT_288186 [Aplosporella prunicola CBS 121167]|uniref:TLDc domain-containing protein n=1 Tax=Aplosporella prunicola CBS 121167 TaxID=1176127 RepID=A0A6A6BE13_9PEZI|nr:uncharacterized protein K452DRAFT_288186 [Aplosporella prunicola CBS 121167]KAF2141494.1 hypothetical protein K452DRAFT_288186 [Aplosporella prunicola CBS 121167]
MRRLDENVEEWCCLNDAELQALTKTLSAHNGALSEDQFIKILQHQAGGEEIVPHQVGSLLYNALAYLSRVPFVGSMPPPSSLDEKQLRRAISWLIWDSHRHILVGTAEQSLEITDRDHLRLLFRSLAAAATASLTNDDVDTTAKTSNTDAATATDQEDDTRLSEALDVLYIAQPAILPFVCVRRHEFVPLAWQLMEGRSSRLREVRIPRRTLAALARALLALQLEPAVTGHDEEMERAAWRTVAAMVQDEDKVDENGYVTWEGFEEGFASMPVLLEPLYRVTAQCLFSGLQPHDFNDPLDFTPANEKYSTSIASITHPPIFTHARIAQLNIFFNQSVWFEELKVYHHHTTTLSKPSTNPPTAPASLARILASVDTHGFLLLRGRDAKGTPYIVGIYTPYPSADRASIQPRPYSNSCRCGVFVLEPMVRFHEGVEGIVGWEEEEDEVRFCGGRLVLKKGEEEGSLRVRFRTGRVRRGDGDDAAASEGVQTEMEVEVESVEIWGYEEEEDEEEKVEEKVEEKRDEKEKE